MDLLSLGGELVFGPDRLSTAEGELPAMLSGRGLRGDVRGLSDTVLPVDPWLNAEVGRDGELGVTVPLIPV